MSEHTPGPWRAEMEGFGWCVRAPGDKWPAACLGKGLPNEANAKLIAAAPDLLHSLEAMVKVAEGDAHPFGVLTEAKEAIAKARGLHEKTEGAD